MPSSILDSEGADVKVYRSAAERSGVQRGAGRSGAQLGLGPTNEFVLEAGPSLQPRVYRSGAWASLKIRDVDVKMA